MNSQRLLASSMNDPGISMWTYCAEHGGDNSQLRLTGNGSIISLANQWVSQLSAVHR